MHTTVQNYHAINSQNAEMRSLCYVSTFPYVIFHSRIFIYTSGCMCVITFTVYTQEKTRDQFWVIGGGSTDNGYDDKFIKRIIIL